MFLTCVVFFASLTFLDMTRNKSLLLIILPGGIVFLLFLFLLWKEYTEKPSSSTQNPIVEDAVFTRSDSIFPPSVYSKEELIAFVDSIDQLYLTPLIKSSQSYSDSIFNSIEMLDFTLSNQQMKELQEAAEFGQIDSTIAKQIFHLNTIRKTSASEDNNLVSFYYKAIGEKNEAVVILDYVMGREDDIYILKGNKIIGKQHVYHRYGLELTSFKTSSGETVFFYLQNFGSGTGIWCFEYYFYLIKHSSDIVPLFNITEESNLQMARLGQSFTLKTKVAKHHPLTLKTTYYFNLTDTTNGISEVPFINDSTLIKFEWNPIKKIYMSNWEDSNITPQQYYSYNLNADGLVFIQAYSKELKEALNNDSLTKPTQYYLNEVKRYLLN